MSFDIYGENLRSGHCEVHPWVHESYPCSVCYSESSQRSEQRRSVEDEYRKYCEESRKEWEMSFRKREQLC